MEAGGGYRAIFSTADSGPDHVDALLRFRKEFFVDQLGWDLQVTAGREVDQFDTEAAYYCSLFSGEQIVGGFRAIRTDFPYLAREVFPHLARTHPFPQRRDAWEISRFGVLPGLNRTKLAKINYALMFRFAYLRGASALIAVADLAHERVLTAFGIRSARYGPPQELPCRAGSEPIRIVAGEIRIADQRDPRFQQLMDHVHLVEITDETLVLGRRRISA